MNLEKLAELLKAPSDKVEAVLKELGWTAESCSDKSRQDAIAKRLDGSKLAVEEKGAIAPVKPVVKQDAGKLAPKKAISATRQELQARIEKASVTIEEAAVKQQEAAAKVVADDAESNAQFMADALLEADKIDQEEYDADKKEAAKLIRAGRKQARSQTLAFLQQKMGDVTSASLSNIQSAIDNAIEVEVIEA